MREKAENYIEHLKDSKTVNTILSYRQDLFQYCDYIEACSVCRTVPVQETLDYVEIINKTMAPSSTARKLSVLNGFFRYLISIGEITDNPLSGVEPPHIKYRVRKKMTKEEAEKLIPVPKGYSAKAVRDRAMLAVMMDTGYKASRMIGLELEDCSGLRISKDTSRLLMDYIYGSRKEFVKNNDCKKLFVNYSGGPMTRQGFWKIVKSYQERI